MKFPWKHLEGPGIGVTIGIFVFLMIHVFTGAPIAPGARRVPEPILAPVVETDPQRLYDTTCAVCHQADGQGQPGTFPPLAGSSWVTEDAETPIRAVLLGISGPIEVNGQAFNGAMPAQSQLNDQQVAAVVSHVRTSFGNDAEPVDEATVAAVRSALAGRTTPWNGGAELAEARQAPAP